MNKVKLKKIVSIFCAFVLILLMFSTYSHASGIEGNDIWSQGHDFISKGQQGEQKINTNTIQSTLLPIGRILVTIATIVLTVVTVVMGIKYMMCKNDAGSRAKLKTQFIGLVVSTIVIYGAQIIWSLLYNFMNGVTG